MQVRIPDGINDETSYVDGGCLLDDVQASSTLWAKCMTANKHDLHGTDRNSGTLLLWALGVEVSKRRSTRSLMIHSISRVLPIEHV